MIGRLSGKVLAQEPDGTIVLDVGGVGYELAVPIGTLGRARSDESGRVTLWVHTHVREDALSLFGFADDNDRYAFRRLIDVSNVGPKIAIAVLSALPAAELARAVSRKDLAALTSVSGIGKKIAERLLLELRDKLTTMPTAPRALSPEARARGSAEAPGSAADRMRITLTGMGFRPQEADRAVASLEGRVDEGPFEERLREALALLAK